MSLLLVRHADAVPESVALGDSDRYLSGTGRLAATALAERILAAGLAVDWLLTSPLVRAVQTAELLAHRLGLASVEATPLLGPGCELRELAEHLGARGGLGIAVGHEPTVSALAALLTGQSRYPGFRPAEAVLIDSSSVALRLARGE